MKISWAKREIALIQLKQQHTTLTKLLFITEIELTEISPPEAWAFRDQIKIQIRS